MWQWPGRLRWRRASVPELGVVVDTAGRQLCLAALALQRGGTQPAVCEAIAWEWGSAESLAGALSSALRQLSTAPCRVAMALPEAVVVRRQLAVSEAMTEGELALALLAEAECMVPLPPSELALDYVLSAAAEPAADGGVVVRGESLATFGAGVLRPVAEAAAGGCVTEHAIGVAEWRGGGLAAPTMAVPGAVAGVAERSLELVACHRAECRAAIELARAVGLRLERLMPAAAAERRGAQLLAGGLRVSGIGDGMVGELSQSWRVAIGLAAGGGHNLLPWRARRRRRAGSRWLAVAMVLLLLGQGAALAVRGALQRGGTLQLAQNAAHRHQLGTVRQRADKVRLRHQRTALRRASEVERRARWRRAQRIAEELWVPLSVVRPAAARYERVELQGEVLRLEGRARHLAAVSQLMEGIEAQALFRRVELRQLQALASGPPAQHFVLEASLSLDTGGLAVPSP